MVVLVLAMISSLRAVGMALITASRNAPIFSGGTCSLLEPRPQSAAALPITNHFSHQRFPCGAEEEIDRSGPRILMADAAFAEIAGSAFLGEQRDGAFHSFFGGVRRC